MPKLIRDNQNDGLVKDTQNEDLEESNEINGDVTFRQTISNESKTLNESDCVNFNRLNSQKRAPKSLIYSLYKLAKRVILVDEGDV